MNCSSAIASSTRVLVRAVTRSGWLMTFETVPTDTPASAATSRIWGVARARRASSAAITADATEEEATGGSSGRDGGPAVEASREGRGTTSAASILLRPNAHHLVVGNIIEVRSATDGGVVLCFAWTGANFWTGSIMNHKTDTPTTSGGRDDRAQLLASSRERDDWSSVARLPPCVSRGEEPPIGLPRARRFTRASGHAARRVVDVRRCTKSNVW